MAFRTRQRAIYSQPLLRLTSPEQWESIAGSRRSAMAKRRRARRPTPQAREEPTEHKRHAAIWLATLSTVVGIATGMFTLRDQVFPRESGSAQAVSSSAFQQQVGAVCDDVNADDRRRARQVKAIHKQLRTAKTTTAQRNALLDGQRQTIARSGDALASFAAIETPESLRSADREVKAAWNRNLGRLQSYAERLDRVETRPQLVAALHYLSSLRTPLARDGIKLMSGLRRLGGANCDLRTPINTKTFPLPPLKQPKHVNDSAVSGSDSASTGAGNGTGAGTAGTNGTTKTASGGSTGTPGTTGGGAAGGTGAGGVTGGSDGVGSSVGTPGSTGGAGNNTGTPGTTGGAGGGDDGGGGGGGGGAEP
jgi:hypothetical protein